MDVKQCNTCEFIYSLEEFPKRKAGKDGTRNKCKNCYTVGGELLE